MPEYQLDFKLVAAAGRTSRHRPTFPVAQLAHAIDPALRQCQLVRTYERFHHNQWYLPLVEAHVRAWLRGVVFTVPPVVTVSGMEVECGKLIVADPAHVATWVQHYSAGNFTLAALEEQHAEITEGRRQFAYDKRDERAPRLAALRQLLGKEVVPDALS